MPESTIAMPTPVPLITPGARLAAAPAFKPSDSRNVLTTWPCGAFGSRAGFVVPWETRGTGARVNDRVRRDRHDAVLRQVVDVIALNSRRNAVDRRMLRLHRGAVVLQPIEDLAFVALLNGDDDVLG